MSTGQQRCQACIDRRDGFYGSYAPPCLIHDDEGRLRATPPAPTEQPATQAVAREWLLDLAKTAGARITGKPDGSEPIEVVFTIAAWRSFDASLVEAHPTEQPRDVALLDVATIAHSGGLIGMSASDALIKIRKITLPYWSGSSNLLDVARAAQTKEPT